MNNFLEAIDLISGLCDKIESRQGMMRMEMEQGLLILVESLGDSLERRKENVDFDQYEQCSYSFEKLCDKVNRLGAK